MTNSVTTGFDSCLGWQEISFLNAYHDVWFERDRFAPFIETEKQRLWRVQSGEPSTKFVEVLREFFREKLVLGQDFDENGEKISDKQILVEE
jgi:hypothetical protein